jgi:nucleoside diphosphate kinase
MNKLSYVLVTPYTIAKSRTGGVIARLLSRTDLELVAAQMITPDEDFVNQYAASLRKSKQQNLNSEAELLADYVEKNMGPSGGRRHRSLLLLFRGEDPVSKLSDICGTLFPEHWSIDSMTGETIRNTYADLIFEQEDPGRIMYFEPAVLTPRSQSLADENLALFARCLENCRNIVDNMSYTEPAKIEKTLVIIKPDNWSFASSRPGTIIDMFSRTGLRIIGVKIFRFSLNEALNFYGSVERQLLEKLSPVFGRKARNLLEREFNIPLPAEAEKGLAECFGVEYAREQFRQIINFMSGKRPDTCPEDERDKPGDVKCMILVYEGEQAVEKIRAVLGPTDPLKAPGGTVRREFGSNVMVNTAHASDSAASYEREKEIVRIDKNNLREIIEEYLSRKS